MRYNNKCMTDFMLAVFKRLNFYDNDYDSDGLKEDVTLSAIAQDMTDYQSDEIKTCFHILKQRNLIETKSNGGYPPIMILDFTAEGYKELLDILRANNATI